MRGSARCPRRRGSDPADGDVAALRSDPPGRLVTPPQAALGQSRLCTLTPSLSPAALEAEPRQRAGQAALHARPLPPTCSTEASGRPRLLRSSPPAPPWSPPPPWAPTWSGGRGSSSDPPIGASRRSRTTVGCRQRLLLLWVRRRRSRSCGGGVPPQSSRAERPLLSRCTRGCTRGSSAGVS